MGKRENFDSDVYAQESIISGSDDDAYVGKTEPIIEGSTVTANGDWATEPVEGGETEVAGRFEQQGKKVSPTVGWLICIRGVCKGEDFRLHTGWNYIGRGKENEICIPDPKVDRVNMAKIAYDHLGRTFVVAPGENTRNLTYWSGKPVLMPTPINGYDVISVGDTDLMFVPLCGEHFSWEE